MRKNNRLLYILALIKIIIPYFLQHAGYELHRDELLYMAEGQHLAMGFMEVPPMLSLFAWVTHLLGGGIFWVKLWPSLFGAATFLVAGKIVQSLGGKNFAIVLLFLPFIFGVYLRIFFLFQPNPPEIFFWTMIAYSIIRYTQTCQHKWLYLFGISVGLGMLSKYSVSFYTVAIISGLLFTQQRKVLKNKHFWYASLIGFIIFIPNLTWQYLHHFPVVYHMQALRQTQLQYISPADFLINQVLFNLPCFFIWLSGLIYTLFSKRYRFIGLGYVVIITLLLLGHGKDYYAMGVYPVLFAFGSVTLEKFAVKGRKKWRLAFIIFPVLTGIPFLPVLLPILPPGQLADLYARTHISKTGLLKWEDLKDHPLPQDFADMLGWKEMAKKVAKAYNQLDDSSKNNVFIFCNNYGMAGAVNYYGAKWGLPQAYSDNASFLYWLPANKYIQDIILVTDDPHEDQHDFAKGFVSVTKVDSVTSPYAKEKGDYIYLFKGADDHFREFFKSKIKKDQLKLSHGIN